jgi:hypothetical protein
MDGRRGGTCLSPHIYFPPALQFFCFLRRVFFDFRTRHSSRRRNGCGKRRGGVRRRDVSRQRSGSGSGGRRRSSSVRCAMNSSARRGTRRARGLPAAACGASVGRVHLCAQVPLRRGASRGQVCHPHCAFFFVTLRDDLTVVASVPSTGHTRASSGTATGPSKISRQSSAVSSARGTTNIPRGLSKRS